jgi:5-methyltetrahydropteroyltriglutamate--homocysteine methyltransferase
MDAAIRYVVAMQEEAGLDVVTDGEWRRRSYIGVIAELAHGFTVGFNLEDGRPWTVVTERLNPKEGGFIAEEVRFLRSITERQIKATVPAPALLGERLWDRQASAGAYGDPSDFVRDCIPILRREIELIVDAGADFIQIDDPHLCLFVDPEVRARYSFAAVAVWRSAACYRGSPIWPELARGGVIILGLSALLCVKGARWRQRRSAFVGTICAACRSRRELAAGPRGG